MQVPTVGSVVKIRTQYRQGPCMIPPQPDFLEFEGKVLSPFKWLNDRQFCLSGNSTWPVRVINADSIIDLKLLSGELKNVNTDVRIFEVDGSKGNKYIVTSNSKGWTCTCSGFQFRKQCKHVSDLSKK